MSRLFFIFSSGAAEQFFSAIQGLFCSRKPTYPGSARAVCTEANTLSQAHRHSSAWNSLLGCNAQAFRSHYLTSQYFSAWIRIVPHSDEKLASIIEINISNTGHSIPYPDSCLIIRLRWGPPPPGGGSAGGSARREGPGTTVGIDFTL